MQKRGRNDLTKMKKHRSMRKEKYLRDLNGAGIILSWGQRKKGHGLWVHSYKGGKQSGME